MASCVWNSCVIDICSFHRAAGAGDDCGHEALAALLLAELLTLQQPGAGGLARHKAYAGSLLKALLGLQLRSEALRQVQHLTAMAYALYRAPISDRCAGYFLSDCIASCCCVTDILPLCLALSVP